MEDPIAKNTVNPVTAISRTAGRLSFSGAATFVILLATLHFISEYAIGRHGWVMVLAFLSLALACVTLFVAIRSQTRGPSLAGSGWPCCW
jgi:hypothetical protein